jgi:hypothetical protein
MQQFNSSDNEERVLDTESKGDLDPPRRRPPTAIGADTSPQHRSPQPRLPRRQKHERQPLLVQLITAVAEITEETVRAVVRVFSR